MHFLLDNTMVQLIDYGINITFTCTGKPKKLCNLLCCNM